MEEEEFANSLFQMNVAEVLENANKAREFLAKGETEDAIAYAMSAGYRMGWETCKKKFGNSSSI